MADAPRKPLGIPDDVARQRLMESAETREIAKNLGMELAEYVEMVIDFAKNPQKEPVLQLLDDATLESLGEEVPTEGDVVRWLEAVKSGEIDLTVQTEVVADEVELKSAEEERKKKLQAAIGGGNTKAAPTVGAVAKPPGLKQDPAAGGVLKQQLLAQRSSAHQKVAAKAQNTQPKPKGGR